jgi:hypothetical protein
MLAHITPSEVAPVSVLVALAVGVGFALGTQAVRWALSRWTK